MAGKGKKKKLNGSDKKEKKKSSRAKKSGRRGRSKSARFAVDIFTEAAMENAYTTCHNCGCVFSLTHTSMPMTVGCRADDIDKHEFDVNYLLFVKSKLYSAGDDGKIKVWTPDLKLLTQVQAHPCSVYCLAASEDTLYSCSNDGTVKSWTLDDLKEKTTLLSDTEFEFWRISWTNGYLYVGDNQGNVRVYNNEKYYGIMNIAEPVKDMAIDGHILFTANLDITVTDVKLEGKNLQNINRKNIDGKAPITIASNKLCFTNREGRDIIVHEKDDAAHWVEVAQAKGAHELIINALAGASWNNKINLFSGGWDKIVKKWMIEDKQIKNEGSCNIEIVINALAIGEEGEVYAAGGDGHIVRIESQ
ncbi:hypothetical protein HHI36_013808 [Cryptolaemus montrouzieri]|uniref:Uncharacterized protein n=1 Tax=Cryptolaemus montrouzieri TaxID=559131 RepID=A0ABD2NJ13_9CUCU